jgi:hypothetical protein
LHLSALQKITVLKLVAGASSWRHWLHWSSKRLLRGILAVLAMITGTLRVRAAVARGDLPDFTVECEDEQVKLTRR